ncbi:hypothetical protein ACT3CD_06275 [Geofilum sp. OHC36d9]|uniref:hypothetical protein n=1 Tax=Geofilum sp. OHC36d9 TaxID=3458413 RepID=UPI0040341FF1
MKSYDRLQIAFKPSIYTFNSISKILGVQPTELIDKNAVPGVWIYEVIEEQDDDYYDFINKFLDLLENNYQKLADLDIKRDDITIWYLYEYDQQCNMEFSPSRLKRLGDNEITLCISCWDSGQELKPTIND